MHEFLLALWWPSGQCGHPSLLRDWRSMHRRACRRLRRCDRSPGSSRQECSVQPMRGSLQRLEARSKCCFAGWQCRIFTQDVSRLLAQPKAFRLSRRPTEEPLAFPKQRAHTDSDRAPCNEQGSRRSPQDRRGAPYTAPEFEAKKRLQRSTAFREASVSTAAVLVHPFNLVVVRHVMADPQRAFLGRGQMKPEPLEPPQ